MRAQDFLREDSVSSPGQFLESKSKVLAEEYLKTEKKPSPIVEGLKESARTVETMVKEPWGVAEAGAHLIGSLYGVPLSGIAGLIGLPFGKEQEFMDVVSQATIYSPKTEAGKYLTDAVSYPFVKLHELGEGVADYVREKTGSPVLGTMAGTTVESLPIVAPLGKGLKGGKKPAGRLRVEDIATGIEEEKPLAGEITRPETLEAGQKIIDELRTKLEAEGKKMPMEALRERARVSAEEFLEVEKPGAKEAVPSPVAKGEQLLPGMKVGLEFPKKGKEVTPTLEGTPLVEAARKAEIEKVQPGLFAPGDRLPQLNATIAEGESRLRSKINAVGEKLSDRELEAIQKDVNKAKDERAEIERLQPKLGLGRRTTPSGYIVEGGEIVGRVPKAKPKVSYGKPDLITWIRQKGGINEKDPSADIRAWKTKESGYVGLVSKKGRFLDELAQEWEWETGERITTDQLSERISDRIMGGKGKGPDISRMSEKELDRYFMKAAEEFYRAEEKGKVPSFGLVRSDIAGLLQRIYDKLDVQAPFNRAGARETGIAVKNFPSMRIYEQKKALDTAKVIQRMGIDAEEGVLVTIKASQPNLLASRKVAEAASKVNQYFREAFERLKQEGIIKYPWPESMKIRLREKIRTLGEALKDAPSKRKSVIEAQLKEARETLEHLEKVDPEYVHAPMGYWFGKIEDVMGVEEGQPVIKGSLTRFFKERELIDMRGFIDWLSDLKFEGKPIFEATDFDIRTILAHYAQRTGKYRGLARIISSAKKEGLIIPKERGWKDGFGEASLELRADMPELTKYYVHNMFLDYLNNYVTKVGPSMRLGNIMGMTKMMAFYNPVFLPAYDVWQGSWLGSMRSVKAPKYLTEGFRSAFKRDASYYEALENGAFSTPYSPRFVDFKKEMQGTISGKIANKMLAKLSRYGKVGPLAEDFYKLSWNMAWKGDEAIRMASYKYLLEKGFTPEDAGQIVAHFHGDYARLTPQARKVLNKIFFTPTFKYAMGHVQANMVKSSINVIRDLINRVPVNQKDLLYAKGALALLAGYFAKDLLMKQWGFETDNLGVRYVKPIEVDGEEKELVVYWPDPGNTWLRQFHKWTNWGDDPNRVEDFMNKLHWDLHPVWMVAYELLKNQKPNFEPVYNPFDSSLEIAEDVTRHAVSRLVAVIGGIEQRIGTEDAKSAYKSLRKDVGNLFGGFLEAVSLAYIREPQEKRVGWKGRKLQRVFKHFMQEDEPKTPEEAEKRINNFHKRLKEILEEKKGWL